MPKRLIIAGARAGTLNYFLDLAPQVKDDEISSTLTFKGCKRWNY
jgi:hypothetical protein